MAYLKVSTPDGLQHVPLLQTHLRIGRLPSNDIILPYHQISREHAELRRSADTWWIIDLDSTNGLQVGGRRVNRYPLQPGERIQLAPDVVVWLITEDDSLTAQATTQMPVPGYDNGGGPAPDLDGPARTPASEALPLRLHLTLPSLSPGIPPPASQSAPAPAVPSSQSRGDPPGPWTPPARATTWPGALPPTHDRERPRPRRPEPTTSPTIETPPEGDLFRRTRSRSATLKGRKGMPAYGSASNSAQPSLYLCLTCGQRTPPDALTCQFCHSPISHPCSRCQLSLLPSQERCPRCQTLNPDFSVSV